MDDYWEWRVRDRAPSSCQKLDSVIDSGEIDRLKEFLELPEPDAELDVEEILQLVVKAEWAEGARFILAKGYADPSDVNTYPLQNVRSLDMFRLLAEFGYDFQRAGATLLTFALGSREVLDWLLEHGLDINMGPGRGRKWSRRDRDDTCRVLNEAAALGDVEIFENLVDRGADPSRSVALHFASRCKDPAKTTAMMTLLVEKYHLDINLDEEHHELLFYHSLMPDSDVPLHRAIENHNVAAVEILLKYGASKLEIAFNRAVECRFEPALELLLEYGAKPSECILRYNYSEKCKEAELKAVKLCLEYGADPRATIAYEEFLASEEEVWSSHGTRMVEARKLLEEAKDAWDAEGRISDYSIVKARVKSKCGRIGGRDRYKIPKVLENWDLL
jgi:ankyrin repeat protein